MGKCLVCSDPIKNGNKYCSNKCQMQKQYQLHINKWRSHSEDKIFQTKNISKYIRRYLLEKYNNSCALCGWNKIHPVTHKTLLEVDHINGISSDNSESNLRVICPNCHSLSLNFRNLNKGNGRSWRLNKYFNNKG